MLPQMVKKECFEFLYWLIHQHEKGSKKESKKEAKKEAKKDTVSNPNIQALGKLYPHPNWSCGFARGGLCLRCVIFRLLYTTRSLLTYLHSHAAFHPVCLANPVPLSLHYPLNVEAPWKRTVFAECSRCLRPNQTCKHSLNIAIVTFVRLGILNIIWLAFHSALTLQRSNGMSC